MKATWLVTAGWRLWRTATVTALGAALILAGVGAVVGGGAAARAIGWGAAASVVFFSLGHVVQVLCARVDARLLLVAALTTYLAQVVVATVLLQILAGPQNPPRWLFAGVAAGVLGWVTGLLVSYRGLRIPVFDPPSETALAVGMTSSPTPDRLHGDERSAEQ